MDQLKKYCEPYTPCQTDALGAPCQTQLQTVRNDHKAKSVSTKFTTQKVKKSKFLLGRHELTVI